MNTVASSANVLISSERSPRSLAVMNVSTADIAACRSPVVCAGIVLAIVIVSRSATSGVRIRIASLVQKSLDLIVQKLIVGRIAAAAGRVPPERWNRRERHALDELALVLRVADRKVEIGFARHIQHGRRNGLQRPCCICRAKPIST